MTLIAPQRPRRRNWLVWLVIALLVAGGFWLFQSRAGRMRPTGMGGPIPVRVEEVRAQTAPRYLDSLGTVQPSGSVLVRSRVDGQLMRLHFTEGQHVRQGDLLAEIDPRPFENSLHEAQGQLARDKAQLENARRDLARYSKLAKGDYIAAQQVESQRSLVHQYEGVVRADEARVEAAALQLEYSRITAPLDGKLGLRQVDAGNMIRAADSNGIVRITRQSPCEVVFTLPETDLPLILAGQRAANKAGSALKVLAYDRDHKVLLGEGSLASLDNQIDVATGTVKLKASFPNTDESLYPNQFVNVRLVVQQREGAIVVPAAAVQLGAKGNFVYIARDNKAHLQPVQVAWRTGDDVILDGGVAAGERLVIDGVDRLRDGAELALR